MGKRKPKTIASLVNDAAMILQRIVRLKAADDNGYARCVTCGKVDHYTNMDGGHWIPRSYTAHKLTEENLACQCKGCNGYGGGRYHEFTVHMIDMYGREWVDHMIATKADTRKYTRTEIMDKIAQFKQYEQEIRQAKGL